MSGPPSNTEDGRTGVLYGLSAYLMWGSFPVFFKALADVFPPEVLAHRILWSATFLLVVVTLTGSLGDLAAALQDRKMLAVLAGTALLVSTNWLTFIWAVSSGRVLESSLGYYINPLVSILLGFLFLGEELNPRQKTSIALAVVGVSVQTAMVGRLPLVSLILAITFGTYGLLRKAVRIPAVTGLAVETILMSPLAAVYLGGRMISGRAAFLGPDTATSILLLAAGAVTSIPLLFYGGALNRLRLSTMGILQYIVPTGQFAWAVFAFGEPFTTGNLVAFGFIWSGLAVYTADSIGSLRPATVAAGVAPGDDQSGPATGDGA